MIVIPSMRATVIDSVIYRATLNLSVFLLYLIEVNKNNRGVWFQR